MSKPVLVQFASGADPSCCQFDTSHDPKKPGPFVPGIVVTPQFSYRGSPGAPVTNVVVGCANIGRHVWRLTPKEQKQSENGSVTYEFAVCLPCTALPGRVVRFELIAHDKNLETSHNDFGIYVGEAQFVKCCGNIAPPPPMRPIPKGGGKRDKGK